MVEASHSFGKFYFTLQQGGFHHPTQRVKMVSEKGNITSLQKVCAKIEIIGTENSVLEIKVQVQKASSRD